MNARIGKAENRVVNLDLTRLADTRMLIQANSGGGKSWVLRLLAEQAAGKLHTLVLDPEGEFSTLREKFDFLIVGKSGDVPVAPRSAPMLARKLMELRVSAVLDLYDLKLRERREFVTLFLDSLMNLPKELWHPTLVLLDEAHVYCPEKGHGEAQSSEAVISLLCQGRKRGLCGVLSTQRLAKLHKDAAAETNNVMIGRTWVDVDQKRAKAILGEVADPMTLREMPNGQFFGFGPAFSINGVFQFRTDTVQTTHPKPGERHKLAAPQPSARIQKHLPELAGLAQKADQEIKDLAQARVRIHELEKELKAKEKADPEAMKKLREAEAAHQKSVAAWEKVHKDFQDRMGKINQLSQPNLKLACETVVDRGASYKPVVLNDPGVQQSIRKQLAAKGLTGRFSAKKPNLANTAKPDELSEITPILMGKCERTILTCLAQHPDGRSKIQLAMQTNYKHSGGGFNNSLGALRSASYIQRNGDYCQITADGLAALGPYDPLPTGTALQEHWFRQLGKCERAALAAIVAAYPNPVTKEEVAAETGYEAGGGGFNNALGRLRTIGLIEGSKDALKASADLFD